jgi:methylamine dehydrogenase accessory protein MauD
MTLLTVSMVLSWIAIIGLGVLVLALTRQIGMLHERVAPAGALAIEKRSLKTGEAAPRFSLKTVAGRDIQIAAEQPSGKSTLLFFLSESCPVCKLLIPVLKSVQKDEEDWLEIVLASDGDEADHRRFIEREGLDGFDYVLSEELGRGFEVEKLPYGVLLDPKGTLTAHGLINNREHLDSLVEAKRLGVATVQEFVGRNAA